MSVYLYNFKNKRKSRRTLPEVDSEGVTPDIQLYTRDSDIEKIITFQVEDTPEHRIWCFWTESECTSFAKMLSSIVAGSGPVVLSENTKVVELINNFNKDINMSHQSIIDFFDNTVIDSLIHAFYIWRIYPTLDSKFKIDVSRVNPKTVVPVTHSEKGYLKYIQWARKDETLPNTQEKFNAASFNPYINLETKEYKKTGKYSYIHIPKDATVSNMMFQKPPIAPAMIYIIFKRLILYYMRKSAQKFWTPLLVGKYGSDDMFPTINPDELKDELDDLRDKLLSLQDFSAVAVPNYIDITALEIKRDVKNFVAELEYLNEEIIFAMMGSIVLIKSKGQQAVSGNRMIENMFLEVIKSLRAKYAIELEKLYKLVCEYNGLDGSDIIVQFPALKEDQNLQIIQMAGLIAQEEGFKDMREYRQFIGQAFDWLSNVTIEEGKSMSSERKRKFDRKYQMKPTGEGGKANTSDESKKPSDESSAMEFLLDHMEKLDKIIKEYESSIQLQKAKEVSEQDQENTS
jgi:hypothetical protein